MALVLLGSLALLAFWFRQCVLVDSCLDNGGKWSEAERRCVGERTSIKLGHFIYSDTRLNSIGGR